MSKRSSFGEGEAWGDRTEAVTRVLMHTSVQMSERIPIHARGVKRKVCAGWRISIHELCTRQCMPRLTSPCTCVYARHSIRKTEKKGQCFCVGTPACLHVCLCTCLHVSLHTLCTCTCMPGAAIAIHVYAHLYASIHASIQMSIHTSLHICTDVHSDGRLLRFPFN